MCTLTRSSLSQDISFKTTSPNQICSIPSHNLETRWPLSLRWPPEHWRSWLGQTHYGYCALRSCKSKRKSGRTRLWVASRGENLLGQMVLTFSLISFRGNEETGKPQHTQSTTIFIIRLDSLLHENMPKPHCHNVSEAKGTINESVWQNRLQACQWSLSQLYPSDTE